MVERFLKQTTFVSTEDYNKNLQFIIPDNFNFAYDVMDAWAAEAPEKTALIWVSDEGGERIFSFAELKEESDRAASYFQELGIGRGDMVMLILKRKYEWWIAMLALCKIGAVAIPATHMLTTHDIVYRNNSASVKAIVCVGEDYVLTQIRGAMPDSPTVQTLISIGPDVPEGFHCWQTGIEKAAPFVRPNHVNDNDDTMLMYFTSGTSGEPKMVAHDFLYPLGHIPTGVFWHNLGPDSIHLTVADTGWGKAVWGKLYGQWIAGAAVFVFDHEKFSADKILRMIEKYRITSFCAPPTVYRFLIHEDFNDYDLSSLTYCTTAGEALNAAVYRKFYERTGVKLMEGFGQTETCMTLGTMPWMEPKPGSMGKPNAQYDIDLVRPDGTSCEDGEKGQIVVRIGNKRPLGLFKEYYRDPELTHQANHDGVYYTGDIAWRDEDGYYWFVGRADDVARDDLVCVVGKRLRRFLLHLRVDLVDRDLALDHGIEECCGACRGRYALRRADQLAVELGDNEADRLCCARRVRDDVDRCGTAAAEIALALRTVEDHLITRVGVDRRHDAALDRSEIIERLRHRCKAVRRAGSRRNNLVILRQTLVVDIKDDRREIIARGSGDNNLLRAGLEVCRSLVLCRVEARALEHNIDIVLAPGNLCGIRLRINIDLLAVDRDGVLARGHGVRVLITPLRGIVLQEMCEHLRARQIVDRDDLIAGSIEHLTERETTDTAKTIDSNFYCH